MKVMVTGANGQLGTDLCKELGSVELIPLTHSDIEITDINSIKQIFEKHQPEVAINTAALPNAEECETNPDKAFLVNALGARNLAAVASQFGAKLIHISTDYVFGGEPEPRATPYTEFDTPIPISVYGRSKLAGENFVRHLCSKHFIIRTSGLFGVAGSRSKGGNFVDTMVRMGRERDELRVVNDQIVSPTYTKDLAEKIAQLTTTEYYGIFHITNEGACSWYEFAREILELAGLQTRLIPITSDQYPQKAKRPSFSVLDNYHLRLLGMGNIRPWQEALKDYLEEKHYLRDL